MIYGQVCTPMAVPDNNSSSGTKIIMVPIERKYLVPSRSQKIVDGILYDVFEGVYL